MPDDSKITTDEGAGNPQDAGRDAGADSERDWSALPGWAQSQFEALQAKLKDVNDESAGRRVRLKEMEERMAKLEQDRQQRLTESERLQELQAEANSLRQFEDRARQLEDMISASNDQRIAAIPEGMRDLVPAGDLSPERLAAWLDKNEARLRKPIAPDLDGGAGGNAPKTTPLTDDEKRAAARFNMTDDQWREAKKRAGME